MLTTRIRIFVDFWNFQLNWNNRVPSSQRCDWRSLPGELVKRVDSLLHDTTGLTTQTILEETRLYASVDLPKDTNLKDWLVNTINRMPSYSVHIRERRSRPKHLFCNFCRTKTDRCPSCDKPYYGSIEKGVDTAIVTDMLTLAWRKSMDIALIVSSDADLIPAAHALKEHGIKTINGSWKGYGHELAKECWGSFNLDSILDKLVRTG